MGHWYKEIFWVETIQDMSPMTYVVAVMSGEPIKVNFCRQELQKVMLSDYLDIEAILRHHSGRVTVPAWYRAAWWPWSVPWLGCIWHLHAYEGCKRSRPGDGDGGGDNGASSLQQCCFRHPAATAAEATADDTGQGTGGGLLLHSVLLPWGGLGGEWHHQPCRGSPYVPPLPVQGWEAGP